MFNKKSEEDIKILQKKIDKLTDRVDDLVSQLTITDQEDPDDMLVRVPIEIYDKIEAFMEDNIVLVGIA